MQEEEVRVPLILFFSSQFLDLISNRSTDPSNDEFSPMDI